MSFAYMRHHTAILLSLFFIKRGGSWMDLRYPILPSASERQLYHMCGDRLRPSRDVINYLARLVPSLYPSGCFLKTIASIQPQRKAFFTSSCTRWSFFTATMALNPKPLTRNQEPCGSVITHVHMHLRGSLGNKTSFKALDVSIGIGHYLENPFDPHGAMSFREFNKLPCASFGESGHLGIHGLLPLICTWTIESFLHGNGLFWKVL